MNAMPDHNTVIHQTQKWLSAVIIGHGLCPFAKREFDSGRIHYGVIEASDIHGQLEAIIMACEALEDDPATETTLLILPDAVSIFEDFLHLLGIANSLMKDLGYEGVFQLASFHPDYRFDGSAGDNDPSNYTNRSPYPMLHILREASVEAALKNYEAPENIPARNIQLTQSLGLEVMKGLLADCYKP